MPSMAQKGKAHDDEVIVVPNQDVMEIKERVETEDANIFSLVTEYYFGADVEINEFIGLLDKAGNPVFTKDIAEVSVINDFGSISREVAIIEWVNESLEFLAINPRNPSLVSRIPQGTDILVVGNTYQNSDLIKI